MNGRMVIYPVRSKPRTMHTAAGIVDELYRLDKDQKNVFFVRNKNDAQSVRRILKKRYANHAIPHDYQVSVEKR